MKRDKTTIWHRALTFRGLLPLIAVSLTLALSSCAKEPLAEFTPGGDRMEVRVAFLQSVTSKATTGGTEVGATDENRLDRVTILIFNQDGSKLENVLSEDVTATNASLVTTQPKWVSDQTLIVTPIANPNTPKKIYAIANWSKTSFDKATYTETMLKAEIATITAVADINGAAAYPMLMSGSKAVENITSLFYNVTVDMERQVSKIRALITLPVLTQDKMSQIEWQTDLMKITVANVPDKSYIVGRNALPATATLLNSIPTLVDDTKPASGDQTIPAKKDLKWSESMYIFENLVIGNTPDDKAKSTYIVVQLPYKNTVTGTIDYDNYYKLYVNDTRDAASPHKVLRNTIYNFNISILGMGLPINNLVPDVNVDDQLTVNSWEKGEIVEVEAPNNYFNIDRTTLGFQFLAGSLQSTIATDVADWKLVKADGSTMFSFAEGKIAPVTVDGITYTLGGTSSAATVDVSKLVTAAVFTTQQMFFEAKNLKVPFTVVSDNGWIPNLVLLAAGWPADILPIEGGLQVAMVGNVLPGGTPAADNPTIVWSTESAVTGITGVGFGEGSGNYAQLAALDVAKYPIGQACKHLGPEWYVSSKDELSLIYNNRLSFGASYSLDAGGYWSATEGSRENSWNVDFDGGTTSINDKKTSASRARCVKGTPPSYIEIDGLKWATGNLVADGANGAKIGAPIDGGLYFQFGSLLGWKGGATGDGTGVCTKANDTFYVGSSFKAAKEIAVTPTVASVAIATVGTTWPNQSANLYYFGLSSYATSFAKLSDFTGFTAGTLADKGVGDPCRFYLGGTWRLPTAEEYKTMRRNYGDGSSGGSANAVWTTSPSAGMNFNNNGTKLFIPASGCRIDSDGSFHAVGLNGYCWSASVSSADSGYNLLFYNNNVGPHNSGNRRSGVPARCVQ